MNHLRWHLLIALIWTAFAVGSTSAADSREEISDSWHCYTGEGDSENWWVEATVISDMSPADLKFNMPNDRAFDRRFHWAACPSAITAEVGQIGSAQGRGIYCITYSDKTQPGPCPYAIVCAIETGDKSGKVRPFFAYFFDPSSERGGGGDEQKRWHYDFERWGIRSG
jgi:hypothetical protein